MLDTAIRAARRAGEIQKTNYGTILNVDMARRSDIKLEVDRLCEAAIIETIREKFPDHSILAEESGSHSREGEYLWIIDPLDGTVNFFYGIPYFCTSVACYRAPSPEVFDKPFPRGMEAMGEPVLGVVYVPPLDELFVAEKGRGATLNGKPIRATGVSNMDEVMIATGFGSTAEKVEAMHQRSRRLGDMVRKIRCFGAAAYDLCNVAAGRLSATSERGLRPWDVAAARIIVEEAGGRFESIEYKETELDTISAGAGIFEELKSVVWKD